MKIFTFPREGMNSLILRLVLIAAFAGMAMMAQAQATVQTDSLDYAPGETALITGSGFQPGETVTLLVEHVGEEPTGTDPQYHKPWDVVADGDGNITSSWDVPTDGDALGATFLLTADGQSSLTHAEWIFTDANTSLNVPNVTGTYGGIVTLTATLTQSGGPGNGTPISNKTINFTLNGTSVGSATTNASGVATLSSISLGSINANTYNTGVAASFAAELPAWSTSSGTGKLTVNKANQTITWSNPSDITYGTALSTTQLNATVAGVSGGSTPGTLTYTPALGTLLNAGANQTLSVSAAATPNYNAATKTVLINVNKADQTITVLTPSPASAVYNTGFTVSATASSGLAVVYTSTAPLSNTGANYTMTSGTGTGVVKYNQAGNTNYNAAPEVTADVLAAKASQTISWSNPANITYGTLLSAAQLNATAPGALTYTPASGTLLDAGAAQTLSVSAAATSNFNAAGPVTVQINVNKADPTITWANPADITYGTLLSATQLNAVVTGSATAGATAPGAASYVPASGTLLNAGNNQALTVNVASTSNYNSATKSVQIDVLKADQIITWSNPANITYGTLLSSTELNAMVTGVAGGSAPGALTYTPASGTLLTAGSQTLNVSAATTSNYKPASASVTLIVDKAASVTTVTIAGGPFTYTGSAITPASVTVTGAGGLSLTPAPVYANNIDAGVNTASASYTYAGDANHNGSNDSKSFTINKANQTITWSNPADITYGTLLSATQLNATVAGVSGGSAPGALTYLNDIGDLLIVQTGGFLQVFAAATSNYNVANKTVFINVIKADQTITWNNPANITYGTLLSATQLNATVAGVSGGTAAGVLTYTPAAGTLLNAGNQTLQVDAAATGNYNAASKQVTLVVDKATATLAWAPGTLSQIYDGSVKTVVATTTPSGLTVNYSFTGTPQNVSTYPVTATINDINYQGSLNGILEIISPATNTVVSSSLNPSVYGQSVTFTATITSLGGTPDNATVTFKDGGSTIGTSTSSAGTAFFATSTLNAGTHSITAEYAGAGIFNPSTSVSFSQVVDKADAVIAITPYSGTYDANTHTASGTATGVNSENLSAGLSFATNYTNAPGGSTAWSFAGGSNYNDAAGTTSVTISKANAVVSVSGYTGVYDAAAHGATGSAAGVAGDALAAGSTLNLGSSFTDVPGGTANWTFTGGTNYNDQSGSVAIMINKATAVVSVSGYTGVYDAAAHGATGSAAGVAGDALASGSTLNLGSSFTNVPGGTANWSFTGGTNYNDQTGTAAIVIGKADAVVTVNGYTGTYDAAAHGATGSAAGVDAGGAASGSTLNLGASFTNVPGGTANWTFNGGNNYLSESGSVAITINKAPLTVVADNKNKYCGQNNPVLTGTLTGVLGGDGITATYSTTATSASGAGTYAITPTLVDPNSKLGNYSVTSTDGTLTIVGLTIDASASSTPIPVNTAAILKATVTPSSLAPGVSLAGIPVVFKLDNGNTGGITYYNATTDATGYATITTGSLAVEVYLITATAGTGCATGIAYLPVYDPNGGFVTGGGWINSPAGAYTPNAALVGKANFGFVSKYRKGSTQVDGNTEFQFQTGNLNFKSTTNLAASLVIAGSQAIYKGTGTINGAGVYNFMVSAVDGQVSGGGGADKFRIKIWNTDGIVYDNQIASADNATATTVLGGGSIVIHSTKSGNRDAAPEEAIATQEIAMATISVYPNPVEDVIHVRFASESKSPIAMQLIDLNGRSLRTESYQANEAGEYEMGVSNLSMNTGFYLLRIAQDNSTKTIKVLKR